MLLLSFILIFLSLSIHQSECAQVTESNELASTTDMNTKNSINDYLFQYLQNIAFNIGEITLTRVDHQGIFTTKISDITLFQFEEFTNARLNFKDINLQFTCNIEIAFCKELHNVKVIGSIKFKTTTAVDNPIGNIQKTNSCADLNANFYNDLQFENCNTILENYDTILEHAKRSLSNKINGKIKKAFRDTTNTEGVLKHMREHYKPVFTLPYSEKEPTNTMSISAIRIENLATFSTDMNDDGVVSLKGPLKLFVDITNSKDGKPYTDYVSGTINASKFYVSVTVKDSHIPTVEITHPIDELTSSIDIEEIFNFVGIAEPDNPKAIDIDHVKKVTMSRIIAALEAAYKQYWSNV